MHVITVDNKIFGEMCRNLWEQVIESGYTPDIIVAVERAGVYVAEEMHIKDYFSVRCRREGTEAKKGGLGRILRYLPAQINIILRKIEYHLLVWRDKSVDYRPRQVEVPTALKKRLKEGGKKVLIVDDAVDSGRSLLSVINKLAEYDSNNKIQSAVITVTRPETVCSPDFALYRNRTIIRFPWAEDRRQSNRNNKK